MYYKEQEPKTPLEKKLTYRLLGTIFMVALALLLTCLSLIDTQQIVPLYKSVSRYLSLLFCIGIMVRSVYYLRKFNLLHWKRLFAPFA
jgi:hypothetical protein